MFSIESFPTECDVSSNPVRYAFQPGARLRSNRMRAFFQPPSMFFPARCDVFSSQMRCFFQPGAIGHSFMGFGAVEIPADRITSHPVGSR